MSYAISIGINNVPDSRRSSLCVKSAAPLGLSSDRLAVNNAHLVPIPVHAAAAVEIGPALLPPNLYQGFFPVPNASAPHRSDIFQLPQPAPVPPVSYGVSHLCAATLFPDAADAD